MANLLHKKYYGNNISMKIDISKAFDTLSLDFILKVLKQFGFSLKLCNWMSYILNPFISISLNGQLSGYFSYHREVKQGKPLSPLLFYIADDVLIKGISRKHQAHKDQSEYSGSHPNSIC